MTFLKLMSKYKLFRKLLFSHYFGIDGCIRNSITNIEKILNNDLDITLNEEVENTLKNIFKLDNSIIDQYTISK